MQASFRLRVTGMAPRSLACRLLQAQGRQSHLAMISQAKLLPDHNKEKFTRNIFGGLEQLPGSDHQTGRFLIRYLQGQVCFFIAQQSLFISQQALLLLVARCLRVPGEGGHSSGQGCQLPKWAAVCWRWQACRQALRFLQALRM